MIEVLDKVEAFMASAQCGCGGFFEADGPINLLTDPPKFPYACKKCGNKELLNERYPKVVYRKALS